MVLEKVLYQEKGRTLIKKYDSGYCEIKKADGLKKCGTGTYI